MISASAFPCSTGPAGGTNVILQDIRDSLNLRVRAVVLFGVGSPWGVLSQECSGGGVGDAAVKIAVNPFGPAVRGPDQVAETMRRAVEHYRDGTAVGFDRIAETLGGELAYSGEVERLHPR
jgi:hypothetical protein